MKRFAIGLIALFLPLQAFASPELAKDWGQVAVTLQEQTDMMGLQIDKGNAGSTPPHYALNVYRFGRNAGALSQWIEATNGPKDLGCIFRGMEAEAGQQLQVLEGQTDVTTRREALRRLSGMFADAQMVADAVLARSPTPGLTPARSGSCTADAAIAISALR